MGKDQRNDEGYFVKINMKGVNKYVEIIINNGIKLNEK